MITIYSKKSFSVLIHLLTNYIERLTRTCLLRQTNKVINVSTTRKNVPTYFFFNDKVKNSATEAEVTFQQMLLSPLLPTPAPRTKKESSTRSDTNTMASVTTTGSGGGCLYHQQWGNSYRIKNVNLSSSRTHSYKNTLTRESAYTRICIYKNGKTLKKLFAILAFNIKQGNKRKKSRKVELHQPFAMVCRCVRMPKFS